MLRARASEIARIPHDFVLEIEDFREDVNRALFAWKAAQDEDKGIWLELDEEGNLLVYDVENVPLPETIFSDEELLALALEFVGVHYPSAASLFAPEAVKTISNGTGKRFSYVQEERGLPLPHTGFYLDMALCGVVVSFRYYGLADYIHMPIEMLEKEEVKEKCLDQLTMRLTIAKVSRDVYENGDDTLRLVYEPELPFYHHPAENCGMMFVSEKRNAGEPKLLPLPEAEPLPNIYEAIGFDPALFTKLREVDSGQEIMTVWRGGETPSVEDLSVDSFFYMKNENTLKFRTNKHTNAITGFVSFMNRTGPLALTKEECKYIAVRFLYAIYPKAGHFFRIEDNEDEDNEGDPIINFHFSIFIKNIPARFGFSHITVNQTTGLIESFFVPDVNPVEFSHLNPIPSISQETAKEIYSSCFDLVLEWDKEFGENGEEQYVLSYRQAFPGLRGDVAFIDAQTGEKIFSKTI
jgi:hypothetical protein